MTFSIKHFSIIALSITALAIVTLNIMTVSMMYSDFVIRIIKTLHIIGLIEAFFVNDTAHNFMLISTTNQS
jgi:hypothetical protein